MTDGPPTTQQMYRELMKRRFGPALRASGLRGSNGRFELPSDRVWALLGFQKSAFSDSDALSFTINLSIIDRERWTERAAVEPRLGARPSANTGYGRRAEQTRIGWLMPTGRDTWWWLRREDDPDVVADEVVGILLDLAVPWLRVHAGC